MAKRLSEFKPDRIDGRAATRIVRDYFVEAHGEMGTLAFQVEEASFDDNSKEWIIKVSMFPSIGAQRGWYEARVSEDGRFMSVRRTSPEKPASR